MWKGKKQEPVTQVKSGTQQGGTEGGESLQEEFYYQEKNAMTMIIAQENDHLRQMAKLDHYCWMVSKYWIFNFFIKF